MGETTIKIDDKLYEAVGLQHEKISGYIKEGNKIVYDFVKSKGLIITGGLAIDILLRSKGKFLYPDELIEFPDIDCISTKSVLDSQELALILHQKQFPNVSAINALHVLTRRVRCDNRVLADITYVPTNLYSKIPFVEIDGQKIIHPWYQHIDQHMLMSKPFIDPPKENIFNRLKKDITRYNLLDELFPIIAKQPKRINITKVTIPANLYPELKECNTSTVIHGLAAYAALITSAKHLLGVNWAKVELDKEIIICEAEFNNKDEFVFESILPNIHLLIDLPDDVVLSNKWKMYEEILDLVPEKFMAEISLATIELWQYTGLLLSVGVGNVSDKTIIIPSVQYVMMFLLVSYFFSESDNESYLVLYCSLKKLLEYMEPLYNEDSSISNSPFFLPLTTIGKVNISQSQLINLMRIRQNLGQKEPDLMCLPANFWPATSNKINEYDYKNCSFFRKSGERL
jgi:hypothetical protein